MFKKTTIYKNLHRFGHNLAFLGNRSLTAERTIDVDEVFDRLIEFCESCYRGHGFSFQVEGKVADVYSTSMAIGILGLLDQLDVDWLDLDLVKDYLGEVQSENGVFVDKAVWEDQVPRLGWEHLCPIVIAAYEYLGLKTVRPFSNLRHDIHHFISMETANIVDDFLTQSNRFFDLSAMALWERTCVKSDISEGLVKDLCDWVQNNGLPKALNFSTRDRFQRATAIKSIYHLLPILIFEGKVDHRTREKVDALVLLNRNLVGGWGPRWDSHACEDIDNLFLLHTGNRSSPKYKQIFLEWFEKSFQFNICADFGLSYRPYSGLDFLGAGLLITNKNQGDMFGSWFRCVCLAYLYKCLNGHGRNLKFTKCFGYQSEYRLG